jgi:hypothetical protein
VFEEVTDERVAELVICGDQAFALGQQTSILFRPREHAHDAFVQLGLADQTKHARRLRRSAVGPRQGSPSPASSFDE